jgi:hypothetical protein
MKNGKVLAKLANDKRVAQLNLTSDNEQVTIILADGFYVEGNRGGRGTFRTAKGAHQFIKSAQKMPVAREGHEIVMNLMSGKPVEQAIDTPHCCRVDSETYWSM